MRKLLEKFSTNEFKLIHKCVGGERVATGHPGGGPANEPCTADSHDRTETPVPGQEGVTMPDYSGWRDECTVPRDPTPPPSDGLPR